MPFRDDDRQGLDPREFPEPDDAGDADDALMPCPYCRELIYEDSPRCPACGRYLSAEDAASDKPWWIVVGVLVCLAMAVYWILSGT